jgi:ADP-heptose:LPS heptosyltransferase
MKPTAAEPPVAPLVLNPLVVLPRVERILVIRLGAMGDVVRTLPAVALLRDATPAARIDWLVEERTAPIVASRDFVDRVLVFPRARGVAALRRGRLLEAARTFASFARELRAGRYDLVLDFHAIARSALLARLSGAPDRLGYAAPIAREGAHRLATHRVRLARTRLSRFQRNEALVRAIVHGELAPRTTPLAVPAAAQRAMAEALGPGPAPIVLHPGSSAAAAHKRWPAARFGELARALARDRERVLVAVGPEACEQGLARTVLEASGGSAKLAPETRQFDDLAALLAAARAVVAADSGPLHTASLVGTPVVQLVGPTDPIENEPWRATPWRRVATNLDCAGCRRGCSVAACMLAIEAESVREAVRALVGAPISHLRLVSLPAG